MEENVVEINGVKVHYFSKINLRELFKSDRRKHPEIYCENVIYCIHNDINGKCYIGRASDFWGRFIEKSKYSHLSSYIDVCDGNKSQYIHQSIFKYKSRNFTVYIIDEADNGSDLNNKEIYWIKTLHSCRFDSKCHGYNMTWGGEDGSYLHSDFAYQSQLLNHNGNLACNTKEAKQKAKVTNIKKYGSPMGMCHTKDVEELATKNMTMTVIFKSIISYLDEIKSDNAPQPITWDTYKSWYDGYRYYLSRHLKRINNNLSDLRKDSRWTKEMEDIFSHAMVDSYYGKYFDNKSK